MELESTDVYGDSKDEVMIKLRLIRAQLKLQWNEKILRTNGRFLSFQLCQFAL